MGSQGYTCEEAATMPCSSLEGTEGGWRGGRSMGGESRFIKRSMSIAVAAVTKGAHDTHFDFFFFLSVFYSFFSQILFIYITYTYFMENYTWNPDQHSPFEAHERLFQKMRNKRKRKFILRGGGARCTYFLRQTCCSSQTPVLNKWRHFIHIVFSSFIYVCINLFIVRVRFPVFSLFLGHIVSRYSWRPIWVTSSDWYPTKLRTTWQNQS